MHLHVIATRIGGVEPAYAALLAAEITPFSQRAILSSAKEDHPRVIADELTNQAAEFVKLWCDQQPR
jgi:hypothetical protein